MLSEVSQICVNLCDVEFHKIHLKAYSTGRLVYSAGLNTLCVDALEGRFGTV